MGEIPIVIQGGMRVVGGSGYHTVMAGDWDKIEREFTPMDLINVLECFELTPERRKWVEELLEKRMAESGEL